LVSQNDTTRRIALLTALDGTVKEQIPFGRYFLRSISPVLLNDSSYSWSLLVLHAEAGTTVELTNANAISVGRIVARVKQLSPENRIFDGARNGVFRIEAGLWHGSGFLTRLPGIETPLVITNDHVVGQ
jgi:hypothetical protein